jgi:hypothetical protein
VADSWNTGLVGRGTRWNWYFFLIFFSELSDKALNVVA